MIELISLEDLILIQRMNPETIPTFSPQRWNVESLQETMQSFSDRGWALFLTAGYPILIYHYAFHDHQTFISTDASEPVLSSAEMWLWWKTYGKIQTSSARMILNRLHMFLSWFFFLIRKWDWSLLRKIFCFHNFCIPEACSLSHTDKL